MAKYKNYKPLLSSTKISGKNKREISQLTIKIDSRLNEALIYLSSQINISRNKLIENLLNQSGLIQEVDENYLDEKS